MNEIDELFQKGVNAFNEKRFYDAHEYWEDIWSNYRLPDSKFIQGLIQISVGFFHLTNKNLNGARGLFKKSTNKFDTDHIEIRGIEVESIRKMAKDALGNVLNIESYEDFDWLIHKKI